MKVVTLDPSRFAEACAELWRRATVDYAPDLLLGIRTGGFTVAEAMPRGGVALLPITRQRPSTAAKSDNPWIGRILRALPYAITDRIRLIEHALLTRKPAAPKSGGAPRPWVPDEAAALRTFLVAHPGARVLVTDDAVDSGATLKAVADLIASIDPTATVKSAVVVTTTSNPVIAPDVSLHRDTLCRFPWSHDFAG